MRGLRLATQFLTRVPVPAVSDFSPQELSRSAAWFPLVGLCIGALVSLVLLLCGRINTPVAAALAVLAWVWITGALHLDGLADLADALAAAHRDPQRFFAVLADPHLGAFGVVSIVVVLILKMAALMPLSPASALVLPLIPAWARLGPLAWSRWLRPLKPGQGERFAWHLHAGWPIAWALVLLAASAAFAPILCLGPVVIFAWGAWLHARLGGTTGDCLGAGVEVTEVVLIVALSLAATAGAPVRVLSGGL
ncbi:MAG TPA: adenosylcobinamide-GDP ribazoletransferase [Steroidobacteraceae bacterium]|nr:adenosylcobinamide-GDP ribazoletransferase [Steroidobacteraceae bacterium]